MNLILFDRDELEGELERTDERVIHVLDVLKCGPEDWFDIGVVDGPRGKARLDVTKAGRVFLEWRLDRDPAPLHPCTLIVGMPRPQTARRLLREMTSIGVERLWFATTDRSEAGYATSRLWTTGEYERHLKAGAEQAFCTRLPEVRRFDSLASAAGALDPDTDLLALDNYEAEIRISDWRPSSDHVALAIGAERGWSAAERDLLKAAGFRLAQLGERVQRVETAAVMAFSILLLRRGIF